MSAPSWRIENCLWCKKRIEHRKGAGRPRVTCSVECARLWKRPPVQPKSGVCDDCGSPWSRKMLCACEVAAVNRMRAIAQRIDADAGPKRSLRFERGAA